MGEVHNLFASRIVLGKLTSPLFGVKAFADFVGSRNSGKFDYFISNWRKALSGITRLARNNLNYEFHGDTDLLSLIN